MNFNEVFGKNVTHHIKSHKKRFFSFIIKNGINQNFRKFKCKLQSAYFVCLFLCMTSLTLRQFNLSKLHNFVSLWEMVKTTIKLCKRFFSIKLTEWWIVLYIRGYDVTHARFKTFKLNNFMRTYQNIKLCTKFFFHKINKIMP